MKSSYFYDGLPDFENLTLISGKIKLKLLEIGSLSNFKFVHFKLGQKKSQLKFGKLDFPIIFERFLVNWIHGHLIPISRTFRTIWWKIEWKCWKSDHFQTWFTQLYPSRLSNFHWTLYLGKKSDFSQFYWPIWWENEVGNSTHRVDSIPFHKSLNW